VGEGELGKAVAVGWITCRSRENFALVHVMREQLCLGRQIQALGVGHR
jgi:hypothetical protein